MSQFCEVNDIIGKFEEALLKPITENSKHDLNNVFDELILKVHLDPVTSVVIERITDLVVQNLACINNEHLLSKFCKFLFNANIHQIVLSKRCIQKLVKYLIDALNVTRPWVSCEILNTLATLLYENVGILEEMSDVLVGPAGILLRVHDPKLQTSIEYQLAALKCVQNLCIRKAGEAYLQEEQLSSCFDLIHDILTNQVVREPDPNDILNTKVLLTSLKGLKNILLGWKNTPKDHLGSILGLLRVLIFFGLREKNSVPFCRLYPSPVGHSISQYAPELEEEELHNTNAVTSSSKVAGHKKRTRKRRSRAQKSGKPASDVVNDAEDVPPQEQNSLSPSRGYRSHYQSGNTTPTSPGGSGPRHQPWIYSSSSDSEFSDSEGNHAANLRILQAKVRQAAYRALQAVGWSTEKKVMFGYWSSFLPDIPGPSTAVHGQTLLSSILKDPSPQVRTAALSFLTDLLEGSRLFLSIADESCQPRTAFIPMSVTIADVIRELHRSLLLALLAESAPSVLFQHLKCLSTLVENVPYGRLKPGLLSAVLKHLQKVLLCKDVQVQVACLTLLGSVVSVQHSGDELSSLLFDTGTKDGEKKFGWLMSLCRDNLLSASAGPVPPGESRKVPVPVQVETLQVLASLLHSYPAQTRSYLQFVKSVIHTTLKDSDTSIQFHGAKILEVFSKCALDDRSRDKNFDEAEVRALRDQMVDLWSEFLSSPLTGCLQHPQNHSLRALCCDALSSIGEDVFSALPHQQQIMCMTLLLGLSSDEFANVRGSAVRCLGIFSTYSSLQETSMFLLDVGEVVIRLLKDPNFNTSLKASWAMGNLSSALLQRNPNSEDEIPDTYLFSLCTSAVKASRESDKIKANAVRTIGNLLRYLQPSSLGKEQIRSVVVESVQALLACCQGKSSMKVQWNACYAINTSFQNSHLITSGAFPTSQVLEGLMNLIATTSNFKVQINALAALVAATERSTYGDSYCNVWFCIFQTLQVLERPVDFKEVAHRDNLCEQICLSVVQMLRLLQIEDIVLLADFALVSQDLLQEATDKTYRNMTTDDKVAKIKQAASHLAELRRYIPVTDVVEWTFLDNMDRILVQLLNSSSYCAWSEGTNADS